jgi:DNA-binding NarL/FixJ family response regulator
LNGTIRVFLADDHAVLRAGLRMLLNAEPDMTVVGEAGSVAQAGDLLEQLQPDVVLLDLSMPEISGLEGLDDLSQKSLRSRFLILTMHNDEQYLRRALSLGAAGYVLKQAANEELLSAIRVVYQGGTYLHPTHRAVLFEDSPGGPAKPDSKESPGRPDEDLLSRLSPREYEILQLIAMGYTNRQAAEKLFLSDKTIETHKARLMTKLGFHSRVELVRFALQRGIIKS